MRELRGQRRDPTGIVDRLTAEGIAPRGARWHLTTVARALRS